MYVITTFEILAKLWYTTLDVDYLLLIVLLIGDLVDKTTYISTTSSDAYLIRYSFKTIIKNPIGLLVVEVTILKSNSTPLKSLIST